MISKHFEHVPRVSGVVACVALAAMVGCSKRARLDEKSVHQLLNQSMSAAANMDADAVCANYAEHAEFRMVQVRFSGSDVKSFNKQEYCEQLRQGYQVLRAGGMAPSTSLNVDSIEIAADGKSAEIEARVSESLATPRGTMTITSNQTATLELIGKTPMFTRVTTRLTGGQ